MAAHAAEDHLSLPAKIATVGMRRPPPANLSVDAGAMHPGGFTFLEDERAVATNPVPPKRLAAISPKSV